MTETSVATTSASGSVQIGQSNQELVGSKKRTIMQKCALVAGILLVLGAITALILVYVLHSNKVSPAGGNASHLVTGKALSLESILRGDFYAKKNNGTWISKDELMFKDDYGNIVAFNVVTNERSLIIGVDAADGIEESFSFTLSPDRNYMLISTNIQRIYRHSTVAYYSAVDLKTKRVYPISSNNTLHDYLLLAEWSPVGNAIVFVENNNIFYKSSVTEPAVAVTLDGGKSVSYGTCDWVYEEEVFSSKTALWFSPDGQKLAYIRFNDTDVPIITIQVYGPPGSFEFQYPKSIGFNYPKVNAPNPKVNLFSIELDKVKPGQPVEKHEQLVPAVLRNEDHIISTVGWQNNDTFVASWMNRVQNRAYIQACNKKECHIFKSINSTAGWVDLFKPLLFNPDGSQMAIITSQQQGTDGGYRHLTLVSTKDGMETPLTSGRFVVSSIEKWDDKTNQIFYMANTQNRPEVLNLYSVRAIAGQFSTCLTCNITDHGVNQTYFSTSFSNAGQHFVLTNEGPSIPRVDVYSWSLSGKDVMTKRTSVLEENKEIHTILNGTQVPNIIYLDVPLSTDNFTARVRLQLPPNADLSGNTKYPLLIDVYAGPDSYNGNDRWDLNWGSYLVSNRSVVHAQINGRGSGLRGDKLMNTIYRHFGKVEVPDQIETAKNLAIRLPYIDSKRIAIWGWSYGGYAAAMALANDDAGVFKCAASVAPVTDWTYYDSIYTERFMGLPTLKDNANGYFESQLSTIPEKFRNKTFFLIHGTMDDNVHYQQSMALARSLEVHDVLFRQLSYPDEDHSLWSVRAHLYHSLGRYFAECFNIAHDL